MGSIYAIDASLMPITVFESVGKVVIGGGTVFSNVFIRPVMVDINPREDRAVRVPSLRFEIDHDSGVVPRYGGGSRIEHDGGTWVIDLFVDAAKHGILHQSGIMLARLEEGGFVPLVEPVGDVDVLMGIIEARDSNIIDVYGVDNDVGWESIEETDEHMIIAFGMKNGGTLIVKYNFNDNITKFDALSIKYESGRLVVKKGFCEDRECKNVVFVCDEVLEREESERPRFSLF